MGEGGKSQVLGLNKVWPLSVHFHYGRIPCSEEREATNKTFSDRAAMVNNYAG